MTLRELYCRLTGLLRQQDPDSDLEDEIASHLELAKADYLRRGVSEPEARRLAAMKFGTVAGAKEHVWEQRQVPGIGSLLQDAKYAARGMRKSPGFTLMTVATVALGIGLCSVMYSLLHEVLLRPLPGVPDPGQLALMQTPVPYPWFESYREHGKSAWTAAAFIGPVPFSIAFDGSGVAEPERITGALVSPDYFSTLRVHPMLGRFFDPQRDRAEASPALVITERFWRTRLNADPGVIGRKLRVNGRAVPIIGVGAPGFFGAGTGAFIVPEVFIAATADPGVAPELNGDVLRRTTEPAFMVLLRLNPAVTLAGAEARLDTETRNFANQREKKGRLVRLVPASTLLPLPKEARITIVMFYGVLICVVLGLTCANLGGLLLARGAARRPEFAIRLSIGADRLRLVRQLLTESAMLAAAGGAGGIAAASGIFRLLRSMQAASNPGIDGMTSGPDLQVALFTFGIATVAAIGFGLLPALVITRLDLMNAMKVNQTTALHRYRRLGLRNGFVVCQVAAAMMLVLIMGFFVVGAQYGSKTEPGFDPAPLSFFSVDPARDGLTPTESADVLRGLPERLAHVAGVESVSLADRPPLSDTPPDTMVSVPSHNTRSVALQNVGPGFFTTLGVTVLRGSDFENRDLLSDHGSGRFLPVAINQTAATELFGDADPLGSRMQQGERTFQVVAVVRYAPRSMLMGRPIPSVFVSLGAEDLERVTAGGTTVVVRARTQIGVAKLRRELAAIDARLTLFHPQTLPAYLAESDKMGSRIAAIYSPIGLFGLILACLGLAGVTAQSVQRRRKEIGIRTALGAQRSQVLRLVMREGAVMVVIGAALGYACASAFVHLLSAVAAPIAEFLAPVASNPALTIGIPSLLIALVAVACYVPARRSASIDPLMALREE